MSRFPVCFLRSTSHFLKLSCFQCDFWPHAPSKACMGRRSGTRPTGFTPQTPQSTENSAQLHRHAIQGSSVHYFKDVKHVPVSCRSHCCLSVHRGLSFRTKQAPLNRSPAEKRSTRLPTRGSAWILPRLLWATAELFSQRRQQIPIFAAAGSRRAFVT